MNTCFSRIRLLLLTVPDHGFMPLRQLPPLRVSVAGRNMGIRLWALGLSETTNLRVIAGDSDE